MALRLAAVAAGDWMDNVITFADLSLLLLDLAYSLATGESAQQVLAIMSILSLLLHVSAYFRGRRNREYRGKDGRRKYISEGAQLLLVVCDIVAVVFIAAPEPATASLGVRSASLGIQIIRTVRLIIVVGRLMPFYAFRRMQRRNQLQQLVSELTKNFSPPAESNRVLLGVPSKIGTLYRVDRPMGDSYIWKIQPSYSGAVEMSGRQAVLDEFHNEVVAMHVLHTCERPNSRLVPHMKWSTREPAGNRGHIAMEIANGGDLRSYTDAYVTRGDRAVRFAKWLRREAQRLYRGTDAIEFTHGDPKAANFFVHSKRQRRTRGLHSEDSVISAAHPHLLFGDVGKARFKMFGLGVRASSFWRMPRISTVDFTYSAAADGRIQISRKAAERHGGVLFWGYERQRKRRDRMDYEDAAEVEMVVLMASALLSAGDAAFEQLKSPSIIDILLSGFDKEDRDAIYRRIVNARKPISDGSANPSAYSVNTAVQVLSGMRLSRSIYPQANIHR